MSITTLSPGTRLGPYEVLAPIGAGGMGEVYKATDTRLDRTVAIKVLSANWTENPEMKQRFDREAQAIASLNHPHICVLHDVGSQDGIDFLVMEYLEGETLAARLERGALAVDEALKAAIAIADALDKAHRQGVVHRDLKPSNVMLTPSGPKLLDFGLAKYSSTAQGAKPSPHSPTRSMLPTRSDITTPGAILGTLQYMAPEQLEGVEADARTDIFAFGVLLHEMVTGKRAFEGKSQVLLISAIATSHPELLSKIVPATPAALDHVVKTCLAKDPKDRWQTARDLLGQLEWVAHAGDTSAVIAAAPARGRREKLLRGTLTAAVLLAVAMATSAFVYLRGPRELEEFRFHTILGAFVNGVDYSAVSPDGQWIVFFDRTGLNTSGVTRVRTPVAAGTLSVIPVRSATPQVLAGSEGAAQPFWSPDSHWIGFFAGGKLKKVEVSGGPPKEIGDAPDFAGGAWSPDGTILFGSVKGLFRVSDQGGKPELVTTPQQGESGQFWPRFLPDGQHYLYLSWSGQASNRAILAGTVGSKETAKVMAPAESQAIYAEPGYLVFRRERTVYAQPFDTTKLTLSGDPVRVADEVTYNTTTGRGSFDVSRSGGVLLYYHNSVSASVGAGGTEGNRWQPTWIDRMGQTTETPGPYGFYRGVDLSPDGKRIAVHRHDGTGGDVWVIEPRGAVTQLTFDASHDNSSPLWSPDGNRIVYASLQKGKWGLYQALSNGSGAEELVCCESEILKTPLSWSPDGKRIVFGVQDPKTAGDLWVVELDGDKKPKPLIATPANESHGRISWDGKWIAYVSDSTGGQKEVYVQPFPSGTGRWNISTGGGDWPRWRRDSKELFYETPVPENSGNNVFKIFSAMVDVNGATFVPSAPREILQGMVAHNLDHPGGEFPTYAISPDAQHILYFQRVLPTAGAAAAGSQFAPDPPNTLTVALHWASGLKGKKGAEP